MKEKPGIRFTEKMVGTYEPSNNNARQTPCEFILTIDSNDVERMLNCDPSHSATISGTVTCLALSSAPLSVSKGKFEHSWFYNKGVASVCLARNCLGAISWLWVPNKNEMAQLVYGYHFNGEIAVYMPKALAMLPSLCSVPLAVFSWPSRLNSHSQHCVLFIGDPKDNLHFSYLAS